MRYLVFVLFALAACRSTQTVINDSVAAGNYASAWRTAYAAMIDEPEDPLLRHQWQQLTLAVLRQRIQQARNVLQASASGEAAMYLWMGQASAREVVNTALFHGLEVESAGEVNALIEQTERDAAATRTAAERALASGDLTLAERHANALGALPSGAELRSRVRNEALWQRSLQHASLGRWRTVVRMLDSLPVGFARSDSLRAAAYANGRVMLVVGAVRGEAGRAVRDLMVQTFGGNPWLQVVVDDDPYLRRTTAQSAGTVYYLSGTVETTRHHHDEVSELLRLWQVNGNPLPVEWADSARRTPVLWRYPSEMVTVEKVRRAFEAVATLSLRVTDDRGAVLHTVSERGKAQEEDFQYRWSDAVDIYRVALQRPADQSRRPGEWMPSPYDTERQKAMLNARYAQHRRADEYQAETRATRLAADRASGALLNLLRQAE